MADDALSRLVVYLSKQVKAKALDFLESGKGPNIGIELVDEKEPDLPGYPVDFADAVNLLNTKLKQLSFVVYKMISAHVEVIQWADQIA